MYKVVLTCFGVVFSYMSFQTTFETNNYHMFRLVFYLLLSLLSQSSLAQNKAKPSSTSSKATDVPLNAQNWDFKEGGVEFVTYKSRPVMKIKRSAGVVVLKNEAFTDGTIEFDHEILDSGFSSMYFHWQDSANNECFYFRGSNAGNPTAEAAVQYAPTVKGVNLWDLLFHYQTSADFKKGQWNHVKLVISGKQMLVYVNSSSKPTLQVPRLEGDGLTGTLAFDGAAIISNLVLKPNVVEGLSPLEGLDPINNDARYIRSWQVSRPIPFSIGQDVSDAVKPKEETVWKPIEAERRGLINLSRRFGRSEPFRRLVWLRAKIHSATSQTSRLHLGFSDDVWVFINGRPIYQDKNTYYFPIRKQPSGRISVENTSLTLPLKEGENELLIGVANDFYGWGIIARFERMDGITSLQ